MLRFSFACFLIGLVAYILGFYNLAFFSVEVGKFVLYVFLAIALITLIVGVVIGKKIKP